MCLAIPMRITELRPGGMALADHDGIGKEISVALVQDAVPGDYVIVHVGFALSKTSVEEADATLGLLVEIAGSRL